MYTTRNTFSKVLLIRYLSNLHWLWCFFKNTNTKIHNREALKNSSNNVYLKWYKSGNYCTLWCQKIFPPSKWKVILNSERVVDSKYLKKSGKPNWNFERGVVGGLNQTAFCGRGMKYFRKNKITSTKSLFSMLMRKHEQYKESFFHLW